MSDREQGLLSLLLQNLLKLKKYDKTLNNLLNIKNYIDRENDIKFKIAYSYIC